MVLQPGDTFLGVLPPGGILKLEGTADDAHGERAGFLGYLRHDGGCAGAGAAAHASNDEYQVCPFNRLGDLVAALLRSLPAQVRVESGSQAAGQVGTDGDPIAHVASGHVLSISVYDPEFRRRNLAFLHVADCV